MRGEEGQVKCGGGEVVQIGKGGGGGVAMLFAFYYDNAVNLDFTGTKLYKFRNVSSSVNQFVRVYYFRLNL